MAPLTQRAEIRLRVMYYDTDCGGVVGNIAYLRFIEQARTELLETLGVSLGQTAESREFPAVLRTEIDYKKSAVLGDTIRVEVRLEEMQRVRFWCGFTLFRDSDQAVLGRCRQQVAFVRVPEGRPIPVPESWLGT